jgi:hypothetical protein
MLLPRPYADELFFSVVARASHYTGLGSKAVLRAAFGHTRKTAFPFLMATEVHHLAKCAGLEPEELVLNHTIFPYAVAFMSEHMQRTMLDKVLHHSSESDCISTIAKSVSFGVRYRRICPECVKQDMSRYGETFWRRSHVLPGVLRCDEHGVPLWDTSTPVKGGAHSAVLQLPSLVLGRRRLISVDEALAANVRRISLDALEGRVPTRESWPPVYREAIVARGFQYPSGNVASATFARHFAKSFGYPYLADLGYMASPDTKLGWPALMVRDEGPPFAPTKHILMLAYILTGESPSLQDLRGTYAKPGKKAKDLNKFDQTVARQLERVIKSVQSSGERVTVKWLLDTVGARAAYKHNSILLPRTSSVLLSFRMSENAARQVGLRKSVRQHSSARALKAEQFKVALQQQLKLLQSQYPTAHVPLGT